MLLKKTSQLGKNLKKELKTKLKKEKNFLSHVTKKIII